MQPIGLLFYPILVHITHCHFYFLYKFLPLYEQVYFIGPWIREEGNAIVLGHLKPTRNKENNSKTIFIAGRDTWLKLSKATEVPPFTLAMLKETASRIK